MPLSADAAETIALKALAWLAGKEEMLTLFMGSTGASADEMRNGAASAEFLGSVLDFVLMDDTWVMEFCDTHGVKYDQVMPARAALPGGEQVHWT